MSAALGRGPAQDLEEAEDPEAGAMKGDTRNHRKILILKYSSRSRSRRREHRGRDRSTSRRDDSRSRDLREGRCFLCGEKGHLKRFCPKGRGRSRSKSRSDSRGKDRKRATKRYSRSASGSSSRGR